MFIRYAIYKTALSQKIITGIVIIMAFFFITFRFTETPRVWIDEGVFTEVAKNFAWHGKQGIQTAPNEIVSSAVIATSGYTLIVPVAASFYLFGTGLWQARLLMIIFMSALVFLFYFFMKKIHGSYWALFSVLLLLSFSPFYGNGRPVQGEIPGIVFLLLGSLLFLYWEERLFNNKRLALFSGLCFGLSAATKPLFLMLLAPSLIISFFVFLKNKSTGKNLVLFFSGFLLPVFLWLFVQFPSTDLFKSALYSYASGNSVSNVPLIPLIKHNLISFFTESTPILFTALMVFAISVFSYFTFFTGKRLFHWTEFFLLVFVAFNWLAYLKGPSWYRHFVPANIVLFLLFSSAASVLYNEIPNKLVRRAIFTGVATLLVFQFYHLFFLSQNSPLNTSNQNILLSQSLSSIPSSKDVLFYDSIGAAIFLKHDNYFQYLKPTDYMEFGIDNLKNINYDYIVTRSDKGFLCYNKKEIGKYFLYERFSDCHAVLRSP